jgi:DUF3073 family protein
MGRGRAKAKQTKVARQLKYNSGGTDLERLRAEIIGEVEDHDDHDQPPDEWDEDEDDLYARYADEEEDDDDAPAAADVAEERIDGNGRRPR